MKPVHILKGTHNIAITVTCSNMDAFAQIMPPGAPNAMPTLLLFLIFLVELQATTTSSIPSPPIIDQPSSLKPLMASLKPLWKYKMFFSF
jgi:hypothetical protein